MLFIFMAAVNLLLLGVILFIGKKMDRQIKQLSSQNRLLTAMRSLDMVALTTKELNPLCQDITNVMAKELGYFFGEIALIDRPTRGIRRIAISSTPQVEELMKNLPVKFQDQLVSLDNKDNLLVQVFESKKSLYADHIGKIQMGVLPPDISDKIQRDFHLKGIFLYPIINSQNEVMGIVFYASLIKQQQVSEMEHNIMESFSAEVGRVLENAILYQDLRLATQELAHANKKLTELDKLKDDFVSVASHELRTPMTAIRSYAWMALYRSDVPLSEKMQKYLTRVMVSTERLINLVNDMLNISRIESGRVEIAPRAFDVKSLVADVINKISAKAAEKNLQLAVLGGVTPKAFADPDKVHQVLLNLLGNALKFTPAGKNITVSFFNDGQFLEVSVKDEGVGITREDMYRLFTKFGRLDNSYVATATSGGTGLGLFICKNLIELMQGKIWANSEGMGKGTAFTFTLPIASQEVLSHPERYANKVTKGAKFLEPVAI